MSARTIQDPNIKPAMSTQSKNQSQGAAAPASSAAYLIEMAKAAIDASICGMMWKEGVDSLAERDRTEGNPHRVGQYVLMGGA